jgi:hypothetical protein
MTLLGILSIFGFIAFVGCGFAVIWAIKKKQIKWAWCFGIVSGIGLTLVVVELASPSSPNLIHQNSVVEISSSQLYAEYQANAVAADENYQNKTLRISGVVTNIGYDVTGMPYVILPGSDVLGIAGVQCMFNVKDKPVLAMLTKGQLVVIQGKCVGYTFNVLLNNCALIP